MMYATVQRRDTYIPSLKADRSHMYASVKGKHMYTKQDIARERVNPRNSDARKNTCYQATSDTET